MSEKAKKYPLSSHLIRVMLQIQFFKKSFIFKYLFHNSHDKFDRQMIEDVVLGSNNELVVTKAQTDSPGRGTAYRCSALTI